MLYTKVSSGEISLAQGLTNLKTVTASVCEVQWRKSGAKYSTQFPWLLNRWTSLLGLWRGEEVTKEATLCRLTKQVKPHLAKKQWDKDVQKSGQKEAAYFVERITQQLKQENEGEFPSWESIGARCSLP